jgi:hypothetical protein
VLFVIEAPLADAIREYERLARLVPIVWVVPEFNVDLLSPVFRAGAPPEFVELLVVQAEIVADLMDDGYVDPIGDLLLAAGDRADRLPEDGDAIRPILCIPPGTAGERDAMVKPVIARRAAAVLDQYRDITDPLREFRGQPVQNEIAVPGQTQGRRFTAEDTTADD